MLSFESLKAAIDRRKHLILEHAPEDWFEDEEKDEEEEITGSTTNVVYAMEETLR